ncbi:MAG: LysR family transcriptional regulator [Leucothrix sp.]
MIPYSLKQLSYFVAAAELKSTSAAARSLHVSQPSISAAIKQLESVLGEVLLIRHQGQGVTPTPHGRALVIRAKALLSLAEDIRFEHNTEASGSVVIGCFVDISPYYLPEILSELNALYPAIRCRIVNAELHEIPYLLKQGALDIGISYGVLLEEGIDYERLKVVTPSAMLPANHSLSQLEQIPLAKLMEEPFVLSDSPYSSDFLQNVLSSRGFLPKVAYNAQTFELQRGMVANGLGVSLSYTQPRCSKSYDGKEIVYRPLVETLPSQDIIVARHSKASLTAVTSVVWDVIRQKITEPL